MIADIKIRFIDFFRKSAPEIGAASGPWLFMCGRGRLGVNLI